MDDGIGSRVRELIQNLSPARTQKEIAESLAMTPDAFSRSVSGQRAFSSIELAELADALNVDVHWLITGREDPRAVPIAARHSWSGGDWVNPGRARDQQQLDDIVLAYKQVSDEIELPASTLPETAEKFRAALGEGFVRHFVSRLESELAIDVVRLPSLSTSYCLSIGHRRVIALQASPHWFHENWSLAHELGHLASGHLDVKRDDTLYQAHENEASAFAAELLMPAEMMRNKIWTDVPQGALAGLVWDLGVSLPALINRIKRLGLPVDDSVLRWAQGQPTQKLIRRHWEYSPAELDPITQRMDEAAVRRFPVGVQKAHLDAIDAGKLGPATLAWMMSVDVSMFEIETPSMEVDDDVLAGALGI